MNWSTIAKKERQDKAKSDKKRKRSPVAANIMASSTAPVAAKGVAAVVRGKTTRTPEQKREQEEAARKRAAEKKRKEAEEREAARLAKEKPVHTNRKRKKPTRKERLAQKKRGLNLVARLQGGNKKGMDAADCPGVAETLSDYEESSEETTVDVDVATLSRNIEAQVVAMDEGGGEVEDDPPDNWTSYDELDATGGDGDEYDAADVLGEADAILNESSQSSNQTWTNPGLVSVPDEMIAGIPSLKK